MVIWDGQKKQVIQKAALDELGAIMRVRDISYFQVDSRLKSILLGGQCLAKFSG